MLELRLRPQPVASPEQVERVGVVVFPLDATHDAAELDVAPLVSRAVLGRQVGQRKLRRDAVEFDATGVFPLVGARAGLLERDVQERLALDRRVAHLDVTEEDHPVRAPIFQRVGEDVDIHERAVVLARPDLAQLAPGLPEPDRGLPGVGPDAEHVELEDGVQLAGAGRHPRLHAEPALPDAHEHVAVRAEIDLLARGSRELGGPHNIVPVGVDLVDLLAEVELGEAVHLEFRLGGRVLRHGGGGDDRQRRYQEREGPQFRESHWTPPEV